MDRSVLVLQAIAEGAEVFLRNGRGLEEETDEFLHRLGHALGVDRSYIFKIDAIPELSCFLLYEWCSAGVEQQIDNPLLQRLHLYPNMKELADCLISGLPFIVNDVTGLPDGDVKQVLLSQGICAAILTPVFKDKMLWGFIGFDDCTGIREWSLAERAALRSAASVYGAAVERTEHDKEARVMFQLVEHMVRAMKLAEEANVDRVQNAIYRIRAVGGR